MNQKATTNQAMNQRTDPRTRTDVLLLMAFCGFLLFYGLGAFGLLGADEPRYAQVAREMLNRSDWVTPTLQGKAWLEKPVLYYWQAILSFRVAGVTDLAARVPAAFDAALLIVIIYLFLRRFRPGSELDGALITASCAGVIGFAHAAATDMPLTASFSIALLAWYAWYESRQRIYLSAFYIFLALGTLAKGPVAPALAAVIIIIFVAAKRDWRTIVHTLWIPGIVLYLAVTLPWYILVQMRNPEFFRVFILEHHLARFSQDVYHHRQPFWFYLPVFLLAVMPWTIIFVLAVAKYGRVIWAADKGAFSTRENSWPLFLLIWTFVPILFFQLIAIQTAGIHIACSPRGHAFGHRLSGCTPQGSKKIFPATRYCSWSALWIAGLCSIIGNIIRDERSRVVDNRDLCPRCHWSGLCFLYCSRDSLWCWTPRVDPYHRIRCCRDRLFCHSFRRARYRRLEVRASDCGKYSIFFARSSSHRHYHINRVQEYGLEFYLNRPAEKYEEGHIPEAAHVLVAAQNAREQVGQLIPGRRISYLTNVPAQKLDLYWVGK